MNLFLIPPSVLTSLLLEGLGGFGTSRAGLESNLATPLSQMEKKEKEREKDLEKKMGLVFLKFLLFPSKCFHFLEMAKSFLGPPCRSIMLKIPS